jgi:phospholipid transport system substrate-binding protein
MNTFKKFAIAIFIAVLSLTSFVNEAAQQSPYKMLADVGGNLFAHIAALPTEQRKQPAVMRSLINKELMPHIDYRYTAYKVLGKYVKTASKNQRNAFVEVMRNYLVITYAQALTQYKNQQVKFELDKNVGNKRIVAVNTQILQQGAPTINIAFKLRRNKKTGQWKAFDMVVEGISLLSSKQAEITRQIRENGLDAVIAQIRTKVTDRG